jgi:hypothetical protein
VGGASTLAGVTASSAALSGGLSVDGASTLAGVTATSATLSGALAVGGSSALTGNVSASGSLNVANTGAFSSMLIGGYVSLWATAHKDTVRGALAVDRSILLQNPADRMARFMSTNNSYGWTAVCEAYSTTYYYTGNPTFGNSGALTSAASNFDCGEVV